MRDSWTAEEHKGLGAGAWEDEPDCMEFISHGQECIVTRDKRTGALIGLVKISFDHPWWQGKESNDADPIVSLGSSERYAMVPVDGYEPLKKSPPNKPYCSFGAVLADTKRLALRVKDSSPSYHERVIHVVDRLIRTMPTCNKCMETAVYRSKSNPRAVFCENHAFDCIEDGILIEAHEVIRAAKLLIRDARAMHVRERSRDE